MSKKMGDLINLSEYIKNKKEDILNPPEAEDFFAAMEMTTDDIVAELVFRLQTKESISNLSTDVLISELSARLVRIEDICVASVMEGLQKN